MDTMTASKALLTFIEQSPSMFHTIDTCKSILDKVGFTYLAESETWSLEPGQAYYTTRNESSLIAFKIGSDVEHYHFQLTAAHSDSPCYKLKANPIIKTDAYTKLNVEAYGGMIDSTWLDKPLGIAGRVLVKEGNRIESRLVHIEDDVALIPNVAIHQNREINQGYAFNRAVDLVPLISCGVMSEADFNSMIAQAAHTTAEQIIATDLFLVNHQKGCIWGAQDEFVSSPKLDDLQCAFSALSALVQANNPRSINLCCIFDNEEVGSNTKQGAESTFLLDTLKRINGCLGKTEDEYHQAVARSFMVSCDNAHALHPNHPELYDAHNIAYMNKGIVIKESANQAYTTDAFSRAVFTEICKRADVPVQVFANRSDMRGGSTLGNISNTQVSMHAVDCGLAQLAMHSSYETAGVKDTSWAIDALTEFYNTHIKISDATSFELL